MTAKRSASIWCLLFTTLITGAARAEEAPAAAAITVDVLPLAGPVVLLRTNSPIANPSTVASIGPDGTFLVDPGFADAGPVLRETLTRLGGGRVRLVTATHYHGDHAEGFLTFAGEALGVVPAAQRERLATGGVVRGEEPLPASALPALTFEDELRLHWNGETVRLFRPPHRHGHTDGDLLVHFEGSKVLAVGDYLFLDKFPIVDEDAGGDLDGYLANARWIVESFPDDTVVVPGHGTFEPQPVAATTIAAYRTYLAGLERSVAIVRERRARGLDVDAAVAEGLPEDLARWGERPRFVKVESWIRRVYASGPP